MTPAQRAQQNNRDGAGRYAEQQLADPGSHMLVDSRELIRNVTTSAQPLTTQLAVGAAAALIRETEGDPTPRLTAMAETQTEHVTMLVADANLRSVYLLEGRVAEVEDGNIGVWPKGLRTQGFRFPLDWVQSVREGYGRSDDLLHALGRVTNTVVPHLAADPQLDRLPMYNPDVHDGDTAPVAACYLLRHRETSDVPFTQGCVLAAVAADDELVYGYLWAPASSGIRPRFIRTNQARVAAMGALIDTYQPFSLTVADCPRLPEDRSSLYRQLVPPGWPAA